MSSSLTLPLSPTVLHINRFFANEQGRDKFNKILQYFSRFAMAHYIEVEGKKSAKAASWSKMFALTRDARKILRLFKFLQEYEKVAKIVNSLKGQPPSVKQCIQCIGFIGLANYWLWDNLVFFAKGDRLSNNPSWGKYSMRGWWVGITSQLIVDTMNVVESMRREEKAKRNAVSTEEIERVSSTERALREQIYVYGYTKNVADWLIAASGGDMMAYMGGSNLSDKTIGILGCVSGFTVCSQVWNSTK